MVSFITPKDLSGKLQKEFPRSAPMDGRYIKFLIPRRTLREESFELVGWFLPQGQCVVINLELKF